MVIVILTIGFGALLILGVPVVIALGLTTAAALSTAGVDIVLLAQTAVASTESFSLIAIPFFILAGELMTTGGLSDRLIAFAEVFVRQLPGGFGLVTVLSASIFAAISGSASATTAAIGAILIPAMIERGYGKPFAVSLSVSSGVLGPLIPPSIAAIIWGVIAELSIAKVFLSTVIPGVLLALGLMVVSVIYGLTHDVQRHERASLAEFRTAIREGIWALGAPVVILGGIYGGAFTPTEAAVVACVYSCVVGVYIERRISWKDIPKIIDNALRISGIVLSIIALSGGFGWLIADQQLPAQLTGWFAGNIDSTLVMLLVINLIIFVACMFMDEIAVVIILGPTLLTLVQQYGVDPIQFGALIVVNIAVGLASPPIGYCLFIGMAISDVSLGALTKAILPQLMIMVAVIVLIVYFPWLATWLPSLMG